MINYKSNEADYITMDSALIQGLLQLQAWVSANGVLKDCMIKVYL